MTWIVSLRHFYDLSTAACEREALLGFVMISGTEYLVAAVTEDIYHRTRGVILPQTVKAIQRLSSPIHRN